MSSNKGAFHSEYSVVQVIKSRKDKKTSIVQNSRGQYYIAKKFYLSDMYALNQIGLMKTIRHPNVVCFHDIIMEKGHVYLIEEYCQEGDLAFHIRRQIRKKRSYFSERVIAKWLLQLLLALEYLHNKKIMHRDIRPQNIFLTSLGNLKLGCFRSSKMFDSQSQLSATIISSPYYMAPQCIQSRGYNQKVDIWAFGCLIYQICALKSTFSDKNIVQQANNILMGENRQIPPIYSKQLINIYNKCLTKNEKDRPSARILLRENYFLQQMKKFVTEKPETPARVPIKHYNVHFNVLAHKKKQKDSKSMRQTLKANKKLRESEKDKQKEAKIFTPILPKIQQSSKIQRRNSKSVQKNRNRQQPRGPSFVQIQKQKSIERARQKERQQIRQNSKQMMRDKSKQQLIRKKSANKNEKFIVNSPNLSKNEKDYQRKQSAQGKKSERIGTQDCVQTPKKNLMAPPILPRPGKQKQKTMAQSKQSPVFSQTKKKQDLAYQLSLIKKDNGKLFDQKEIKSSLTKIFQDLNIKQQQQQQFSFELEDENLARLTLKKNDEGNQLLETYKTKLQQLIQQINYKYCPNMEPIQQRTQQFDSNTFASLRRH